MVQERVAENVYLFTSDLYAQVNAGAVVGPDWSILIDTLAHPEETLEIREFLEHRLNAPVRYVINTHYHSDHSLGTCWFPSATVVGHARCRDLLDTNGRKALEAAKKQNRDLKDVDVVLPNLVFDSGELILKVGKRTLRLVHLPGHSPDNVGVLVVEDKVLFSGDIMMPLPYIVDGDYEVMIESMKRIPDLKLENLIQGHGDVILRGEVQSAVKDNLSYLSTIRRHVKKAGKRRDPEGYLRTIDVESCGKARILLNGLVEQLHQQNLMALYERWFGSDNG
jgi:glyoxylase-like metal-dependent hydrolase (beta-lactamase superfamily II)